MRPVLDWEAIAPGAKAERQLEVRGEALALPVLVVKGSEPGPTLVVSAGVHGDEYEGVQALFDLYRELEPEGMRGALLAVPVANPPAFWNLTRVSPVDGANLARVFPGKVDGTETEAIAYAFDQEILSRADFYLDLHSAGVKWLMPTMIGYHEQDVKAKAAAEAFGAPVIWCHPTIAPGRTVSAAADRGVPVLYAEARGAGRIDAGDLEVYARGLRRLMAHLGMIERVAEEVPEDVQGPVRLYGDGNIDSSVSAGVQGFLTPCVQLLERVEEGQRLGVLQDLWGGVVELYLAPRAGVVALIHACPLVQPGEPVFLVTERVG